MAFCVWLFSLGLRLARLICAYGARPYFVPFDSWTVFRCVIALRFVYPVIDRRVFGGSLVALLLGCWYSIFCSKVLLQIQPGTSLQGGTRNYSERGGKVMDQIPLDVVPLVGSMSLSPESQDVFNCKGRKKVRGAVGVRLEWPIFFLLPILFFFRGPCVFERYSLRCKLYWAIKRNKLLVCVRNITSSDASLTQEIRYWVPLCEVLEKAELICGGEKSAQYLPAREVEGDTGEKQESSRVMGMSYSIVTILETSEHFSKVNFLVCKSCLNKAVTLKKPRH